MKVRRQIADSFQNELDRAWQSYIVRKALADQARDLRLVFENV